MFRSIKEILVPLDVKAVREVLFLVICQLLNLSKDTENSLLDSLKRHKVLFLGTIMGPRGSYRKVRNFFHFPLLPAFLQLDIFLPLISAPTGFHDWGLVTRWAWLLITSNCYLPSTPKDRSMLVLVSSWYCLSFLSTPSSLFLSNAHSTEE